MKTRAPLKRTSRLTSRASLDPGCGKKRYRSQAAAERALERIASLDRMASVDGEGKVPQRAYECERCAFWHLTSMAPAKWTRPATAARATARDTGPSRKTRRDTIPPSVRRLVSARDPWCIRCGDPRDLEIHHRRLKGQGGDSRGHTDCPCNLVTLHRDCHRAVHLDDRREAEAEGYILPAETTEPGMHPVLVRTADGGMTAFATCAGAWIFEAPAEMAAS